MLHRHGGILQSRKRFFAHVPHRLHSSHSSLMKTGLVFSIEEFSVFDGPGIRTSVFLMGCPLRCEWCHNPEGQAFTNRIVRAQNGCLHCGACLRHAKEENGELFLTEQSLRSCPQGLLRYCATPYDAATLCQRLGKNIDLLNASGGGVTFSGGEPTAQPEFLLDCLSRLKGKTDRAIQTSGACDEAIFQAVLGSCDRMLFDVKLIDEAQHIRYTGASNRPILRNLEILAGGGKPFVIRTPLIPTVTDSEANLRGIAQRLNALGIGYIELLPYNKMAGAKYALIGRQYQPSFDGSIVPDPRIELFAAYGVRAVVL